MWIQDAVWFKRFHKLAQISLLPECEFVGGDL